MFGRFLRRNEEPEFNPAVLEKVRGATVGLQTDIDPSCVPGYSLSNGYILTSSRHVHIEDLSKVGSGRKEAEGLEVRLELKDDLAGIALFKVQGYDTEANLPSSRYSGFEAEEEVYVFGLSGMNVPNYRKTVIASGNAVVDALTGTLSNSTLFNVFENEARDPPGPDVVYLNVGADEVTYGGPVADTQGLFSGIVQTIEPLSADVESGDAPLGEPTKKFMMEGFGMRAEAAFLPAKTIAEELSQYDIGRKALKLD